MTPGSPERMENQRRSKMFLASSVGFKIKGMFLFYLIFMVAILFDKIHHSIQHYFSLFLAVLQGSRAEWWPQLPIHLDYLLIEVFHFWIFNAPKSRSQSNKEDCQKCWVWAKFIFPFFYWNMEYIFSMVRKAVYTGECFREYFAIIRIAPQTFKIFSLDHSYNEL